MRFTLAGAALAVLDVASPEQKVRRSIALANDWKAGRIDEIGEAVPPDRPARPERPALRPPREVPRRRINSAPDGRIVLLHALAHIELNAIDLAWDIIARFTAEAMPKPFYDEWTKVAQEEAYHFTLLSERLNALGASYGDLPAHDGLWEAAQETSGDLLARLAVVPLVLEARGLDVTPAMIEKLRGAGDEESAGILEIIYRDEIGHVATGRLWFEYLCERRGMEPKQTWRDLVRKHFRGGVKPPFNAEGRAAGGFTADYYEPLLAGDD